MDFSTTMIRRALNRERLSMTLKKGVEPFERLGAYVANLPPGDRLIVGVLGLFVVVASLVGVIALERTFLVVVPVEGGTLMEGVVGTPRFVNPLLALSDADRDLAALTYAGLMGYGADGTLAPVLAERYDLSEDGRTYTFTLREGVEFSDGNPVTAADVVFTVVKAQDPTLRSPALSNWANIRAEAVDSRTIRFTLPRPYAPFIEQATLGILPAHLWESLSAEEFPFSPYMTEPVGAGPFEVASVARSSNGAVTSYVLTAFNGYALNRPYLDGITFRFYNDASDLAVALRTGEVKSAYGVAEEGALAVPYARVFGVFFNPSENPALAERAVREALSNTIDRRALIDDVLGGYGTPSVGPLPTGIGGDLPLPETETRRTEARELLADAGWEYDEEAQAWLKGDQPLAITLRTANVPELKAVASRIQGEWRAIGVPTQLELYPATELTQNVIRPRDFEALYFGEVIGTYPDLYAFWYSGERNDPGLNIAGYASSNVDKLLEEARAAVDDAEARAALIEAERLIAADYPAAFTHTPDFLYVVPDALRGVELTRIAAPSDRLRTARFWYLRTERVWPWFVR